MHPFPNILRSSVVGCVRKYELSKKKVSPRDFFLSRPTGFSHEERIIDVCHLSHLIRSMTKKRSSEIIGVKMDIVS